MAIKLTCRNYDGTNAILRSRNKAQFVGIPVFPSRMFRHGFIFCRNDAGIATPQDLSGKKIGFLRWVQTAGIWMRGVLVDEYGVSAKDSQWYIASMHHWDDADPGADVTPRDGTVIRRIESHGKNASERACRALFDREVDVLGITESQLAILLARNEVRRLFENWRDVEADYFLRTKILPVMHILAIRKELLQKRPKLPQQLFQMFSEAKRWARHWRRSMPSLVEAWPQHNIDEEQRIFESDPWAYGLEANRHVISKFLAYCHAQGISARDMAPEELFVESTWSLHE